MNGKQAYVLSKTYTKDTADTLGSLKGAPCTITNTQTVEEGIQVTFTWEGTDGKTNTTTIVVPKGSDGVKGDDGIGVTAVAINTEGHLICTLSDGTSIDSGKLPSAAVDISKETGNAIVQKSDGLYVKQSSGSADISEEENNSIEMKSDGLYARKEIVNGNSYIYDDSALTNNSFDHDTLPVFQYMKAQKASSIAELPDEYDLAYVMSDGDYHSMSTTQAEQFLAQIDEIDYDDNNNLIVTFLNGATATYKSGRYSSGIYNQSLEPWIATTGFTSITEIKPKVFSLGSTPGDYEDYRYPIHQSVSYIAVSDTLDDGFIDIGLDFYVGNTLMCNGLNAWFGDYEHLTSTSGIAANTDTGIEPLATRQNLASTKAEIDLEIDDVSAEMETLSKSFVKTVNGVSPSSGAVEISSADLKYIHTGYAKSGNTLNSFIEGNATDIYNLQTTVRDHTTSINNLATKTAVSAEDNNALEQKTDGLYVALGVIPTSQPETLVDGMIWLEA